jgi:hypothetical protein
MKKAMLIIVLLVSIDTVMFADESSEIGIYLPLNMSYLTNYSKGTLNDIDYKRKITGIGLGSGLEVIFPRKYIDVGFYSRFDVLFFNNGQMESGGKIEKGKNSSLGINLLLGMIFQKEINHTFCVYSAFALGGQYIDLIFQENFANLYPPYSNSPYTSSLQNLLAIGIAGDIGTKIRTSFTEDVGLYLSLGCRFGYNVYNKIGDVKMYNRNYTDLIRYGLSITPYIGIGMYVDTL